MDAPDVRGEVELASGVAGPESWVLVISAGPTTRVSENVTRESLSVPVADVSFPYRFTLRGSVGSLGNVAWPVSARVVDPPHPTSGAILEGRTPFVFECDSAEPSAHRS